MSTTLERARLAHYRDLNGVFSRALRNVVAEHLRETGQPAHLDAIQEAMEGALGRAAIEVSGPVPVIGAPSWTVEAVLLDGRRNVVDSESVTVTEATVEERVVGHVHRAVQKWELRVRRVES